MEEEARSLASSAVETDGDTLRTVKREARIDFWFGCIRRGTLLVYVVTFVILSVVLIRSDSQAGGFEIGTVLTSLLASTLWSALILIGSCYASIPLATLVVAAVRGVHRRRRTAPRKPPRKN